MAARDPLQKMKKEVKEKKSKQRSTSLPVCPNENVVFINCWGRFRCTVGFLVQWSNDPFGIDIVPVKKRKKKNVQKILLGASAKDSLTRSPQRHPVGLVQGGLCCHGTCLPARMLQQSELPKGRTVPRPAMLPFSIESKSLLVTKGVSVVCSLWIATKKRKGGSLCLFVCACFFFRPEMLRRLLSLPLSAPSAHSGISTTKLFGRNAVFLVFSFRF
jgi:hypothetical protein